MTMTSEQAAWKKPEIYEGALSALTYGLIYIPCAYSMWGWADFSTPRHGPFSMRIVIMAIFMLGILYQLGTSIQSCWNSKTGVRRQWISTHLGLEVVTILHHPGEPYDCSIDGWDVPSPVTAGLFAILSCLFVVVWASFGWMPADTVLGLSRLGLVIVFATAAVVMALFTIACIEDE